MQEIKEFVIFFRQYVFSKLIAFGKRFEKGKDIVVAFLIIKRGKYATSFLNTSFLLLVAAALIGGPIIAQNNPFISQQNTSTTLAQSGEVAYNPYENSLTTVISVKPRDKMVDYTITAGDTLASIAQKFDVSIDTVRWANDLKSDTIKPGDSLKIPPVTGVVHKVVSGDNIYSIAKKYRTDAQKIVNFPFNDFADLDTFSLTPGQLLYVPDGIPPEEAPAAPSSQMFAQVQSGVRGSSNFIWPTTGIITQYPVWYHMALDIANPAQPPIVASDKGTVIFAGCINWGYGCHVIIDHGNGYKTLYGHMSKIIATPGEVVAQGQEIGIMGSTGRSTGTHCHFEIRQGDTLLNPLNFLK